MTLLSYANLLRKEKCRSEILKNYFVNLCIFTSQNALIGLQSHLCTIPANNPDPKKVSGDNMRELLPIVYLEPNSKAFREPPVLKVLRIAPARPIIVGCQLVNLFLIRTFHDLNTRDDCLFAGSFPLNRPGWASALPCLPARALIPPGHS